MLHRAEDSNPRDVGEGRMLEYLSPKAVAVPRQALGHGQSTLQEQETAQAEMLRPGTVFASKDYRHKAMAGRGLSQKSCGGGRVDVDRGHLRRWEQLMASNIHPKKHQELMGNLGGCNSTRTDEKYVKHVPISIQKAISAPKKEFYTDHI